MGPPSRPRGPSSLLTGVPLASRLESTTSLQPSSQVETRLRFRELSACSPTLPPLPRPGPGLTTNLTSCTPRGPLSTGTWERAWRRESSPRPGRTWLHSRRTTRRLAWILLRGRRGKMERRNIKQETHSFSDSLLLLSCANIIYL